MKGRSYFGQPELGFSKHWRLHSATLFSSGSVERLVFSD